MKDRLPARYRGRRESVDFKHRLVVVKNARFPMFKPRRGLACAAAVAAIRILGGPGPLRRAFLDP